MVYPSVLERSKRSVRKDGPFAINHDDQVLTFYEWCKLNRISERTARRVMAAGDGPTVTWLSSNRMGITVRANRAWQQSRSNKRA